jgi:hypothetical protein
MTKSALSAVVGLNLSASGALAMDWTLKSTLAEQVEISNNYFLQSPSSGVMYTPMTTLGADAIGGTPDMKFTINTFETYREYAGPAASGLENVLTTYNHLNVEKTDEQGLVTYNVGASYRTQDLAQSQLQETGLVTGRGLITTASLEGGMTRELSPTDTLHWSARAASIDFTGAGSTNYTDVNATSNWSHLVNRSTDLTNLLIFDWLSYDDAAKTQLMIAKATEGMHSQITSRLTFTGAAGAVFFNATGSGSGSGSQSTVTNPTTGTQTAGSSFDWIGNMNLAYQLSAATKVSLLASRTTGPSITGQIFTSDVFGASLAHTLNELSSITLTSQYAISQSTTTTDLFLLSATFNYSLTPEWQSSLVYTFRQLLSTGATSDTFLLRVSRIATMAGSNRGESTSGTDKPR